MPMRPRAAPPHIFFALADDTGWNNVGWHARANAAGAEVSTPNLDALATAGIELTRSYAFKYCSPSRCAIQSGRNPIHVQVGNAVFRAGGGIPDQMTCLASKLKQRGYRTVMVGKWHAGMRSRAQTPRGRGYDAALTYFNPDNDFWSQSYSGCPLTAGSTQRALHVTPIVDLWEAFEGGGEGPAAARNNSCASGRTFVPFNGCGDELGRRCASQWTAEPFDRTACIKCATEANISACGQPLHQVRKTPSWPRSWANFSPL